MGQGKERIVYKRLLVGAEELETGRFGVLEITLNKEHE